jgi:hypothetical protein
MSSIKPTIGRKVWFYEPTLAGNINNPTVPFDATIVYVWGDTCVNLRVTDHQGNTFARCSVPLRDPGADDRHGAGDYVATWMPYQTGQARAQAAAPSAATT